MGRDEMPTFALAVAIVVGSLVLIGVPLSSLLLPLLLFACPLMMIFMMRDMTNDNEGGGCHSRHVGHQEADEHEGHQHQPHHPTRR